MAVNLSVDLTLDPEFIRKLVAKARAAMFENQKPEDDDPGSNAVVDGRATGAQSDVERLEEETEPDHFPDEVRQLIDDCNEDEAAELVALVWIGRGDFEPAEFTSAFQQAKESREIPTSEYLLTTPLFPSYLEIGLEAIETD